MKSSIPIRRLRGPAFLILAGAFLLAERAVTREAGPAPGESQGSEGESGFAGPRWGSS